MKIKEDPMDIKLVYDSRKEKWFYSYLNENGQRLKRTCRGCKTRTEAETFVSKLKIENKDTYLIKNIARDMYLKNSEHLIRLSMFGKKLTDPTLNQKRNYIDLIIKRFGNYRINEINFAEIAMELILDTKHSASWKNGYLDSFAAIYDETAWKCPKPIARPKFQRFIRNSKKADILTTEELTNLFKEENWKTKRDYVLFSTIISCGLRLGEARGLKLSQFIFEEKLLIVDGFCKNTGERTNFNKAGNESDLKIRVVPLPDELIILLKDFIAENKICCENNYIFTREDKKVVRQEYLEKTFKRAIKLAGIKVENRKLVPHSLRYTYITRLRRFLPVDLVQQIVGHSNSKMTDYYTRFGFDELQVKVAGALEAVNKLFI